MVVKKIAYVVPCYNEEEVIEEFYRRVAAGGPEPARVRIRVSVRQRREP